MKKPNHHIQYLTLNVAIRASLAFLFKIQKALPCIATLTF